jgi:hypothetical protein
MYKLGRRAVKHDSRTLKLGRYMTAALPSPPASVDWTKGIASWGMMLNDDLGDCTIAGVAHAVQVFSTNAGTEAIVPDAVVLSYYESWDGYVDGDPSTDNGGIELDVLTNWKAQGFDGHKLTAFADPDVKNIAEIRQAINLFGGIYIGMSVTNQAISTDSDPSVPWDVGGDTTIAGGHCVFVTGYDANFIYFISWGQVFKMTYAYWSAYVDEAHALLSPDFIAANGLDPQGFNLAQLEADLAAIV